MSHQKTSSQPSECRPPRFANWLLDKFSPPGFEDELQGDLLEMYAYWLKTSGARAARWRYGLAVLRLIRPVAALINQQAHHHTQFSTWQPAMIRNYIKIAWRNILSAKGFAAINVAGLATGMAAAALIFLWIQSELNYDRFYSKTDRLFQVYNRDTFNGATQAWETTPVPLAPALKQGYVGIEDVSRYRPTTSLVATGAKGFNADGAYVDSSFLNLFDLPLVAGQPTQGLASSTGILITQALSEKLFGTANAVGRVVQLDQKDSFLITGVLTDLPDNSQFKDVSFLLPWSAFRPSDGELEDWSSNNNYTYVLLSENTTMEAVNQKIKPLTAAHLRGMIDDVSHRQLFLHPASQWHLYAKQVNGQLTDGKIVVVRLFGLIAALILLIAAVNFINLSTARSERRAKEVGVRKVAGAHKASLIVQFLSESVLLALLSGIIALPVVALSLPTFNQLTAKQLSLSFSSPLFWLTAIAFTIFTGLLAGSYPAFFLSRFHLIKVMKGGRSSSGAAFTIRKALVVTQFTFAIVLIIATLVIRQQINYAQSREKGYNQTNLLFTTLTGELPIRYHSFQQDLLNRGAAISVSKSLGPLTTINSRQWGLSWAGSSQADKEIEFDRFATDADFLLTMGARLSAGRAIDVRQYPTDSTALLLNQTAVKRMRLTKPVGAVISFDNQDWHVVGVVKDFIFGSPYEAINPVIIHGPSGSLPLTWASIRLNPANTTPQNLAIVETLFNKYNPGYPFEYAFADTSYKAKFIDEQRTGTLTGLFTGLTILIACLGLFGLAAYSAQQRTKEIGVRKVLGATVVSIIGLLTKDFILLLGIAFLIGAPIGWYTMNQWLEGYSYRVMVSAGVFIVTLLSSFLVVVFTVSLQAVKAALVNPARSLRSE